jgi:glucosamine 6-phosphate synthetase-like amidotransferase/phosphosugar isomerase protein
MCGICGWIKPKNVESDLDLTKVFVKLLLQTQERGTDATGYYSLGTGIVKEAVKAKDFIDKGFVQDLNDEQFVIGHCRAASSNSKKDIDDSKNAHPFESKNWILVHNGVVNMDPIKNYPYTSNVDSEYILSYIEKTSLKNAIASIKGSAALVIYSKAQKKLYFWTDGVRPLSIAYYHGIIFFASTKSIMKKAMEVKTDFGIFPKISYATIYENELLEFDLAKQKFFRKGVIEPKKDIPKEDDDVFDDKYWTNTSSYQPTKYVNGTQVITSTSSRKELPRGCTSNPASNKVVRIGTNGVRCTKSFAEREAKYFITK